MKNKLTWLKAVLLIAPFIVDVPSAVPVNWDARRQSVPIGDQHRVLFITLIFTLLAWSLAYSWHHSRTHAAAR